MNHDIITTSPRPSATFTYRAGPGGGTNPGSGGNTGSDTGTGGNVLGGDPSPEPPIEPPTPPVPLLNTLWLLVLLATAYRLIRMFQTMYRK